jgi:hypothetical protein
MTGPLAIPAPHAPVRMRRRRGVTRLRAALALVVLLAIAACKGDGGGPVGPAPTVAGRWSGSAKAGLLQFDADFTQAADSVGGTGRFSSPLGGDDFTVRGAISGTNVELVLTSDELGATTFRGRFVAADRITGVLDRPNDEDLDLTLDRD